MGKWWGDGDYGAEDASGDDETAWSKPACGTMQMCRGSQIFTTSGPPPYYHQNHASDIIIVSALQATNGRCFWPVGRFDRRFSCLRSQNFGRWKACGETTSKASILILIIIKLVNRQTPTYWSLEFHNCQHLQPYGPSISSSYRRHEVYPFY